MLSFIVNVIYNCLRIFITELIARLDIARLPCQNYIFAVSIVNRESTTSCAAFLKTTRRFFRGARGIGYNSSHSIPLRLSQEKNSLRQLATFLSLLVGTPCHRV